MAKRKKTSRIDASDEGFGHNPFAALGGVASDPEPAPPAAEEPPEDDTLPARVVLHIERKGRGGKTVTRVSGLSALTTSRRKNLARELGRALGVGASVESEDVIVQGDQRDRVRAFFEERGVRCN